MTLLAEVSPGELIDKITILEIKLENIADETKRLNVQREYRVLTARLAQGVPHSPVLAGLREALKEVNRALWRIEDDIREQERSADFGDRFIALARAVYRTNDRRAEIKREINLLTQSELVEEKSYAAY